MIDLAVYGGLFATAFVAATLLPMQSEAALVALLLTESYSVTLLVVAASLGNVAGSVVNWLLGRQVERFSDRRWFPVGPAAFAQATAWYQRYGKWSLLLSWAPIVGDPLTLVAGALKEPFPTFLLLVTIAKVGRYLALTALTMQWL